MNYLKNVYKITDPDQFYTFYRPLQFCNIHSKFKTGSSRSRRNSAKIENNSSDWLHSTRSLYLELSLADEFSERIWVETWQTIALCAENIAD